MKNLDEPYLKKKKSTSWCFLAKSTASFVYLNLTLLEYLSNFSFSDKTMFGAYNSRSEQSYHNISFYLYMVCIPVLRDEPYQIKTLVHTGILLLKDHLPFHICISCFLWLKKNIFNSETNILLMVIFLELQIHYVLLKFQNSRVEFFLLLPHNLFHL